MIYAQNVFSFERFIDDPDYPVVIELADLDEDGRMDLLTASPNEDAIAWYRNEGDGSFSDQLVISSNADAAESVAVGDLDMDGDLDVIGGYYANVDWYRNDGEENFSSALSVGSFGGYTSFASDLLVWDIDEDGDLDILAASYTDPQILIYHNDGTGVFSASVIFQNTINNPGSVNDMKTADLNGDEKLDLIYSLGNGEVRFNLNLGDEQFESSQTLTNALSANNLLELTDIDADGDVDILVGHAVKIGFENDGQANFGDAVFLDTSSGKHIHATDVNGDGLNDLFVRNGAHELAVIENLGDWQFSASSFLSTEDVDKDYLNSLDVDLDGDMDLIYVSNDDRIAWYENNPSPETSFVFDQCSLDGFTNTTIAYADELTTTWNFGNGETSNSFDPDFYYTSTGEYEVTLSVCNPHGCNEYTETVEVDHIIDFEIPNEGIAGEPISFLDQSTGYTNWSWVFGDGEVSLSQNANHTYNEAGEFLLQFVITDSTLVACSYQHEQLITISEVSDIAAKDSEWISHFPNPASEVIIIHLDGGRQLDGLTIYSSTGQEVLSRQDVIGSSIYDINHLSEGLYFFRVTTISGEKGVGRFLKN